MATLCAVAASIGAPVAVVLSQQGSGTARQRGMHVRVHETTSLITQHPQGPLVRFSESVTNTGTVPIYGFILGPARGTLKGVWENYAHPRPVICNVRSERGFWSSPVNAIGCGLPRGLKPGSSVTFDLSANFVTRAQAAATSYTRAKLTPQLTAREGYGF